MPSTLPTTRVLTIMVGWDLTNVERSKDDLGIAHAVREVSRGHVGSIVVLTKKAVAATKEGQRRIGSTWVAQ